MLKEPWDIYLRLFAMRSRNYRGALYHKCMAMALQTAEQLLKSNFDAETSQNGKIERRSDPNKCSDRGVTNRPQKEKRHLCATRGQTQQNVRPTQYTIQRDTMPGTARKHNNAQIINETRTRGKMGAIGALFKALRVARVHGKQYRHARKRKINRFKAL